MKHLRAGAIPAALLIALGSLVVALLAIIPQLRIDDKNLAVGSVAISEGYYATTTGQTTDLAAGGADGKVNRLLKNGFGQLGSVIITGWTGGKLLFYDATTSDASLRGPVATTSRLIASIGPFSATSTYVFDATFDEGLYLLGDGAQLPTTTITYK